MGQKSLWIFAPRSKTDKRREQKQGAWDKNHFGFLLHAQKLINGGNKSNSFGNKPEFSKNYRTIFGNSFLFLGVKRFCPDLYFSELNASVPTPKITEQFSEIPSYFSELNASVPTSTFY
ncbi:hypothetical protein AQ486_14280 [Enterococcus faecalis]|nr:hypothetical protein AQ486_14280 [Enterococcus faecalis]